MIMLQFTPEQVQKIVEYLWKRPYGEVADLIEIIRQSDQAALAKKPEVVASER